MTNIVLFGKPGAGKGTQAEFLKQKIQLTHISGDVFRFNLKNDTELGKQAQVYGCWRLSPRRIDYKMLIDEVNKRH
jgi:adenylate kinase